MADTTDAAPGVVVSTPVVGDPAAHAKTVKASADALTAQAETVTDAAGITSLDRDPPAAPAKDAAPADPKPGDAEPTPDPDPDADPEPQAVGEGEEAEAEAEAEGEDESEGEAEGEEAAVEMIEFDFGGNKLEVPKDAVPPELATKIDEFVKGTWSDYSRKSEENAKVAKSNMARGETLEKMAGLNGAALQTYSTGLLLRTEIDQLRQIDLPALWQSNPDQARQVSDALGAKQGQFEEIVARVGQQEAEIDATHQVELDRRSVEGRTVLDKRIPDFSTKHASDLVKYAVSLGMGVTEAGRWALNPTLTEMGYKAMLYDRMQAAAAKAGNGARAQTGAVPGLKAKGAAAAATDPDRMPMGALAKHLGLPG